MAYDNNMRGVLFKNNKKKAEPQPDYTGKIEIDNEEFWLSAWLKESKSGNKFLSLSVQRKEAKYGTPEPVIGDDVPF